MDRENERDEGRDEPRHGGPPSEERVRFELVLFADLIHQLERKGRLVAELPFILHRMGDLRRLMFDYEVRVTERLLPIENPAERAARELIREVEERMRQAAEEWAKPWTPESEEGGQAAGEGDED
jgi:hypothetical protein